VMECFPVIVALAALAWATPGRKGAAEADTVQAEMKSASAWLR
jgi:hypothetical protein